MEVNKQKEILAITGMTCANCALGIKKHLDKRITWKIFSKEKKNRKKNRKKKIGQKCRNFGFRELDF